MFGHHKKFLNFLKLILCLIACFKLILYDPLQFKMKWFMKQLKIDMQLMSWMSKYSDVFLNNILYYYLYILFLNHNNDIKSIDVLKFFSLKLSDYNKRF